MACIVLLLFGGRHMKIGAIEKLDPLDVCVGGLIFYCIISIIGDGRNNAYEIYTWAISASS